ncbi:MAG: hypothetical protein IJ323_03070 [Clostridia bacterium]|nr:hypothetical protein [Clostridia bacterium]
MANKSMGEIISAVACVFAGVFVSVFFLLQGFTVQFLAMLGASFICAGAIIFAFALNEAGFDFTKLGTQKLVSNTYEITDSFENVKIDVNTSDVIFVLASDGKCRVEFIEEEKVNHIAEVYDSTLKIGVNDTRKWYEHIGIFSEIQK